jgi:acyl-coenzyme A thioesterase PaaI-like protein
MAGTVLAGSRDGIYLLQDKKGRTYIKGLNETREKFLKMGGDRNLFEKWVKQSAVMAAKEATRTAPVISGKLALSVRGYASKKAFVKNRVTGSVDSRMVFGGIITAGSARVRNVTDEVGAQRQVTTGVQYGRAVSLGTYRVAGQPSKTGNRIWRTTVRGKKNPYIVKARNKMKPAMVRLLNFQLNTYIKQKGFQTNGL